MSSVNGLGFAKMRTEIRKEKDKYKELEQKYDDLIQSLGDEDTLWEMVKDIPSIRNKFVIEYLKSLNRNCVKLVGGNGGYSVLTPPMRPKNLEDAGRLAKKIIKY